jgi:hypothetical protein
VTASTAKIRKPGLLAALLCLLFALGPVTGAGADPVSGGKARLTLGPDLSATLRQAGVRLSVRGQARLRGRTLSLPVTGGDLTAGSGQMQVAGGLRLAAAGRTASLSHLVLDTSSGALIARLDGRQLLLAIARRPRVRRDGFGFAVTLGKLVLTDTAAHRLDRDLGLDGLLDAGDVLGTVNAGARFSQVTVTDGSAYLGLDAAFMAKLTSLAVGGGPLNREPPFSRSPLAVGFGQLHGVLALDLATGELESAEGMRLYQGVLVGGEVYESSTPGPEITLQKLAVDIAAKTVAAELQAQPSGAAETTVFASLQIPVFHKNAYTGEISIPDSPLTLSPSLAGLLNRTFAEPRGRPPVFAAGEALGFLAFGARTHGRADG